MNRYNQTLVIGAPFGANDARAHVVDLSSAFEVSAAAHGAASLFMAALNSGCLQSGVTITRPMFLSPPEQGPFYVPSGGLDILSTCAAFGGGAAGITSARAGAIGVSPPNTIPTATVLVVGADTRSPAIATASPFVSFNNLALRVNTSRGSASCDVGAGNDAASLRAAVIGSAQGQVAGLLSLGPASNSQSSVSLRYMEVSGGVGTRGGGIGVSGDVVVSLTRSVVSGNAAVIGGGLFVTAGAAVSVWDTAFSRNVATSRGGAVAVTGGFAAFYASEAAGSPMATIHSNAASVGGGGLYVCGRG